MSTVLLTGATGAIGSVLSQYLLNDDDTRLRLLLRAKSPQHLEERLQALFGFWGIDPRQTKRGRVEAVAGDVTAPGLGLTDPQRRALHAEVTHVIHSAGTVKLNRPIEEARRAAVDSARHVVDFVEGCRPNGAFEKLEFVSTVGVGGKMGGVLPERFVDDARRFNNTYEEAKAEAEEYLKGAMRSGLPVTIHRPSMVVGESRGGRIVSFQVFYHLCEFLSGRRTSGVLPDVGDARLDIVPVDYVARAIHASSRDRAAAGRVFHLCSGSQAPRIADLAVRVRALFGAHGRTIPVARTIPVGLVRLMLPLATRLTSGHAKRALQSLPYFLAYLEAPQIFANADSDAYFSSRGVHRPAPESYLDDVLSYYLSRQSDAASRDADTAARVA